MTTSVWRRFFGELQRRRVVRVAIAYAAAAFVVVQAAQLYFPALGLPDWAFRAVAVLSLVGLPVALALSWIFDVTPEGVRRTRPEEAGAEDGRAPLAAGPAVAGVAAVLGVAVVVVVAGIAAFGLNRGGGVPLDRQRVLVMMFENQAGDPALDPVGRMATEWLIQGLAGTGVVEVVPALTVMAAARAADGQGADGALDVAQQLGAGTVVWGTYFSSGGSLSLSAHISDVASGRLIGSLDPVSAPVDDPAAGLVELRDRVMSGLGASLNPRLAGWPGAASQPWSWAAYQEYADGMERYVVSDFLGAATHFGRAFAMDTSLLIAALWEANSNANGVDIDAAIARADQLEERRHRLSPYDRAFLDRLRARLRGDLPATHAASLRMIEIAPAADDAVREAALDALRLNRAEEALDRLLSLDPERGWVRGWREYWFFLATAYHQLGRHEEELRAAREGRLRDPGRSFIWDIVEATALAALGRADDALALVDETVERERHRAPPAMVLANVGAALLAHGHDGPAMELFGRAAAEPAPNLAPLPGATSEPVVRARAMPLSGAILRADALLVTGDHTAAELAFLQVVEAAGASRFSLEQRLRLTALAGLALTAAVRGDQEAAERRVQEIAATQLVNEQWREPHARAAIAAAQGDRSAAVVLLREAFARGLQHTTNPVDYQVRRHHPALSPLRGHGAFHELMRPAPAERRPAGR
jgi:tetratricopeptide (TPR) repeat protein/TolB-like protein